MSRLPASGSGGRYRGRNSGSHGGFGILPLLLLIAIAVVMWKLHGGNVSSLRNLQYSIFH